MRVEVVPVKDGPDYAPAVTVTVQPPYRVPWEPKAVITLDLETARVIFGQLGQAIEVIEANADPS